MLQSVVICNVIANRGEVLKGLRARSGGIGRGRGEERRGGERRGGAGIRGRVDRVNATTLWPTINPPPPPPNTHTHHEPN